jgi:hypothetical protein
MTITNTGKGLIFLISQPRSGSTLLQYILASHPKIASTAEPWIALLPLSLRTISAKHPKYNFAIGQRAIEDFLATIPNHEQNFLFAVQKMLSELYNHVCDAQNKPYFLDKTPMYSMIIPELVTMFPDAKYIFLVRNPLAVLSSILNTWINGEWVRLPRHRFSLLEAPDKILTGMNSLGPNHILVRYETLVQEPRKTIEKLCDFLSISFDPGILQYTQKIKGRMGDPTGVYLHQMPSPDSLMKWLSLGETSQTRHLAFSYLDALGRDTLAQLGYDSAILRQEIEQVAIKKKNHLIFPWQTAFKQNPNLITKCQLVFYEFLQNPRPIQLMRQVARLLTGKLKYP